MSQLRTNSIVPLDGLPAGASGGGIIQVVTNHVSTSLSESVGANTDGTTKLLSVLITPTSTSSKILVIYNLNASVSYSFGGTTLRRNTTKISIGTNTGSRTPTTTYLEQIDQNSAHQMHSCSFIDSPATTSQIDYNVVFSNTNNGTNTFYMNRTQSDSDSAVLRNRTSSSIIVMEISN